MKNLIKLTIFSLAFGIVFTSCKEEDYTGYSTQNFSAATIQTAEITADAENDATFTVSGLDITIDESSIDPNFDEVGATFNVMVTTSEAVAFDTYIDITETTSNLSSIDYEISRVYIAPTETVGYGSITIFKTGDMEGNETATFKLNTNSPNIDGSKTINVTITDDYLNDNFKVNFDWTQAFEHEINSITYTGNYEDIDVDVLVLDDSFSDTGNYSAATGSVPETVEFRGMADGTYYLEVQVYDNPFESQGFGDVIPFAVSYEQDFYVDATSFFNDMTMSSESTSGSSLGIIAKVTKLGHIVTIEPFTTCSYLLDMHDSFGDGWNGGFVTAEITLGSIVTYTDYTLDDGTSGTHSIPAPDGAGVNFYFTGGAYDSEITFEIYDPSGTEIVNAGPSPADGLLYSGTNSCN